VLRVVGGQRCIGGQGAQQFGLGENAETFTAELIARGAFDLAADGGRNGRCYRECARLRWRNSNAPCCRACSDPGGARLVTTSPSG